MKIDNRVLSERAAFALRLGVGVGFGLVMACLLGHRYGDPRSITTLRSIVYTTLVLTAFVWWAGAGTMRRISLGLWGLIATTIVAGLAWFQAQPLRDNVLFVFMAPAAGLILPLLFIGHELASSGDRAGRPIAPYPTYFDQAWKHGVQLALSLLFTGLFWVILWLGATLLNMIGINWLGHLLQKSWFFQPVTGAAMACAVQLGDVQDKLLTNVRALILSVLSWLLPVIAAIGLLFLGGLCASGLEPLWKTKAASVTLLGACIAFVLLINAAYQQGDAERPVHVVMKWATRLACFLLLVFAGLAAYSLWLRIDEYGLSVERVLAGAGVIIAAMFGLGYTVAAVLPGRWLACLEGINIAMAFVKVVIFLGLLTPIADPARLSVTDQVERLQSGRTTPDRFDWHMLRFESGRYGTEALTILGNTGRTKDIRAGAATAAALKDNERWVVRDERWVAQRDLAAPVKPDDMRQLRVIYPAGGALPASFNGAALEAAGMRECAHPGGVACTAALIDLNGDRVPEIVVRDGSLLAVYTAVGGAWKVVMMRAYIDDETATAFDTGQVTAAPHAWSDLKIGETTLAVTGGK